MNIDWGVVNRPRPCTYICGTLDFAYKTKTLKPKPTRILNLLAIFTYEPLRNKIYRPERYLHKRWLSHATCMYLSLAQLSPRESSCDKISLVWHLTGTRQDSWSATIWLETLLTHVRRYFFLWQNTCCNSSAIYPLIRSVNDQNNLAIAHTN
jgi:hypothetical protein